MSNFHVPFFKRNMHNLQDMTEDPNYEEIGVPQFYE